MKKVIKKIINPRKKNGLVCANCLTNQTPQWRPCKTPNNISNVYCNACGCFFKRHGKHRNNNLNYNFILLELSKEKK